VEGIGGRKERKGKIHHSVEMGGREKWGLNEKRKKSVIGEDHTTGKNGLIHTRSSK